MPRATKPSITDFRIGFFVRILSEKRSKPKPESAGYKESNDLRDLEAIRNSTREVAKIFNS
jgi:hypothetical protein